MTAIIAEAGINCNGSVDIAKQLMDMAKECGADFVKFQKRTISVVYSTEELDKPRESPWGTTTREQKHGLEFQRRDYDEIDKQRCCPRQRHRHRWPVEWATLYPDNPSSFRMPSFCMKPGRSSTSAFRILEGNSPR